MYTTTGDQKGNQSKGGPTPGAACPGLLHSGAKAHHFACCGKRADVTKQVNVVSAGVQTTPVLAGVESVSVLHFLVEQRSSEELLS